MARKRTARATPIASPKLFIYEIGIRKQDDITTFIIEATRLESDGDSLFLYDHINGDEVKTGEFNDWVYFFQRGEFKKELEEVKLPENWGLVDGKKF